MDQPTVGQLKDEIAILEKFMETPGYLEWVRQLSADKELIEKRVFDYAPKELGDILNREQEIGQRQYITDQLVWFSAWKDALTEQLQSRQTNITTNTSDI